MPECMGEAISFAVDTVGGSSVGERTSVTVEELCACPREDSTVVFLDEEGRFSVSEILDVERSVVVWKRPGNINLDMALISLDELVTRLFATFL